MTLSPADQRHLQLTLADLASGTPRQWWHLEIAAQLPATQPPGMASRLLVAVIHRFGLGAAWPILRSLALPGLAPYQANAKPRAGDALAGAQTALVCLCVLLGLGTLNATREFALLLIAGLGAMAVGWQAFQQLSVARRTLLQDQAAIADTLAPSESSLGLAGLLVSSGLPLTLAQDRAARWAATPELADTTSLAALGMLAPVGLPWHGISHALVWWLAVATVAWPCWLSPQAWQLLPATVGLLLVHFVANGHTAHWYRAALRSVGWAAAAGALAWLWHHR
jgi:hypothetical protein